MPSRAASSPPLTLGRDPRVRSAHMDNGYGSGIEERIPAHAIECQLSEGARGSLGMARNRWPSLQLARILPGSAEAAFSV
jgi:hypothetical protein